jgi:hypothetical protein
LLQVRAFDVPRSFSGDAGVLDDLGPFGNVGLDERLERVGRAGHNVGALLGQRLADKGVLSTRRSEAVEQTGKHLLTSMASRGRVTN